MRWITGLSLGAIVLGLSACAAGGATGSDGIASLASGTTTTAAAADGGARPGGDGEDRFYLFARCMRDKGIDLPDPEPGGGAVRIGPGSGIDMGDPKFEEAQKACAKELGDIGPGGGDPARLQEFQDKALAHARCMRENGIDMPDPTFGEGGRIEQRLEGDISPDDPKFQEAQKACESLLPFGGAARAGRPGS